MNSSQRLKVLFLLTKADTGGAQKYVSDIASHLDPQAFETYIAHGDKEIPHLSNTTRPWLLFLNDWLAVSECVSLYKRHQPNIIHLNNSKAGFNGSLAACWYNLFRPSGQRAKVVFTAHGWVFNPDNTLAPWVRFGYRTLHRVAAYFQDSIICVSQYDYDLALRYRIAPARKLKMIYNGISASQLVFAEQSIARNELQNRGHRAPIENRRLWAGSIGRLVKEKNYQTLIEAAAQTPEVAWFLIGDGPEQKLLSQLNQKLQSPVHFIAPDGHDARYLRAFDIFILTSIKEGLPYAALEAMAAGLPLIVTDAGGLPELARYWPHCTIVPKYQPQAISDAVRTLLKNPPKSIQSFPEVFQLSTMLRSVMSIYRGLAA